MASSSKEEQNRTVSSASFNEFHAQLQGAALKATKSAMSLPADLSFHRSMDMELSKNIDSLSSRVLSITNRLLDLAAPPNTVQSSRRKGKRKLEDQDDVVDDFPSLVVDYMDRLLEQTDMALDNYSGRIQPPAIAVNLTKSTTQKVQKRASVPGGRLDPALQHAAHLPKPQIQFKRKVNNNNNVPWSSMLSHKFNAQIPLGHHYSDSMDTDDEVSPYEITHIAYPARIFQTAEPVAPESFEDTPFQWVDTPAAFQDMIDTLRNASDIAVDLEHHSYRSFSGFLCLMQISTRKQDWVIDLLELRDDIPALNEIFTDPRIIKVFHGAESDIVWLQQDFDIYVVNLFDTYHASKVLEFPRHGLANLLEMYCDFTPDKRYQLADWRIRPLPQEMLDYARSDTHFLLYIYDNLRNALLDRGQSRSQSRVQSPADAGSSTRPSSPGTPHNTRVYVEEVLRRSEQTALRTYEKEVYDAEGGTGPAGWDTLAKKWNKGTLMNGEGVVGGLQREVYKCIHAWRDKVAREEDESTRYLLPNHYVFQLAENPPADIINMMATLKSVPPVMKRRAKELLDAIKDTVRATLSGPVLTNGSTATTPEEKAPVDISRPEPLDSLMSREKTGNVESRLWPGVDSKISRQSSSLFGSTLPAPSSKIVRGTAKCAAKQSSLFGNTRLTTKSHDQGTASRFLEVLSRIHSGLVIAPSIPKVAQRPDSDPTPGTVTAHAETVLHTIIEDGAVDGQVEIPFVPASERQAITVVDDSIITVGQLRQKKRKRAKKSEASGPGTEMAETEEAAASIKEEDTVEPFDYSSVPNLLDDHAPDRDAARPKKKKQKQRNGGVMYGNFPAPPRAHREYKGGNQSSTFK